MIIAYANVAFGYPLARRVPCSADRIAAPSDKELLNALGKPIVGKLKEKLIKFRTDKGKTVSSIEICDECDEVIELECSVLEELDLNVGDLDAGGCRAGYLAFELEQLVLEDLALGLGHLDESEERRCAPHVGRRSVLVVRDDLERPLVVLLSGPRR
jgi:hypothetical protein